MRKILFFFILTMLAPVLAFGNAASPYQRPSDNVILFDDETGIQLKEEWINFKIENNFDRMAEVEVTYLLENIDRENENIDLLFIAPYLNKEDIGIVFDDKEITVFNMKKVDELPKNWNYSNKVTITDPISKKILQNRLDSQSNYEGWNGQGFQFKINIPKGETKKLILSYLTEGGYYSFDEIVNDVYTHLYYLTPAEFWEGDAKVHLKVEFPDNNYEIASNIELVKLSDNVYEGYFEGIPQNEWFFNYVDKKGLVFGTNNRNYHNIIAAVIVLATLLAGFYLKKRKKTYGILLMVLIIPELLLFRPTYGTMFLLVFLGPVLFGIPILILLIRYFSKKKRSSI